MIICRVKRNFKKENHIIQLSCAAWFLENAICITIQNRCSQCRCADIQPISHIFKRWQDAWYKANRWRSEYSREYKHKHVLRWIEQPEILKLILYHKMFFQSRVVFLRRFLRDTWSYCSDRDNCIGREKNNLSGRISNSQETFKNWEITFQVISLKLCYLVINACIK